MPSRFRPPRDVPPIGQGPDGMARFSAWRRTAFSEIAEDLARLGSTDPPGLVERERVDLPAGAQRRISPSVQGASVVLPCPTPENAGRESRLLIENPSGTVTVVCTPGVGDDGKIFVPTINGASRATFTLPGVVSFTSNGVNDWKTQAESPSETATSTANTALVDSLDAEYVLGSAHPSLPSGRVATDSTEIDAVLTSAGLISWSLITASVGLSKLANLAGLSVPGRSASSSGAMAAITGTAPKQVLRINVAGTAVAFELAAATGTENGYASYNVYESSVSPVTFTTAADIPAGNIFTLHFSGPGGGGGAGASASGSTVPRGGGGGAGGARLPPIVVSRAALIAMLPVVITLPAGGAGGTGVARTAGGITVGADGAVASADATISANGVTVYTAFRGGGGSGGNDASDGSGGGGGGLFTAGTTSTTVGTAGGRPLPGSAASTLAVATNTSTFGGGFGANSATASSVGGPSVYGGGGGGASFASASAAGGQTAYGGSGGGAGGVGNDGGTAVDGSAAGGVFSMAGSAGGALANGGTGPATGADGTPGVASAEGYGAIGGGGGGGANGLSTVSGARSVTGGNGGVGGQGGGGGGGGGGAFVNNTNALNTALGGNGGNGGSAQLILVGLPG